MSNLEMPAELQTPVADVERRRLTPEIHAPVPATGPAPDAATDALEEAYREIFGECLPADARATIYGIAAKLRLHPGDGMWLILLNFQYYLTQYEKIPWRIQEASAKTLQSSVDSLQKMVGEASKMALSTFARTAEEIASDGRRGLISRGMIVFAGVFGLLAGFVLGNAFPRMAFVNNFFINTLGMVGS